MKLPQAKWEKELADWNQNLGNMFGGFLGMFLVLAIGMFFYEGCSWRSVNGPDNIVTPKEEETAPDPSFNASDWILFGE